MKTLHDIVAGVTNGGKWEEIEVLRISCKHGVSKMIVPGVIEDEEYIVHACSTWPDLVRALERIARTPEEEESVYVHELMEIAQIALEKALAL